MYWYDEGVGGRRIRARFSGWGWSEGSWLLRFIHPESLAFPSFAVPTYLGTWVCWM